MPLTKKEKVSAAKKNAEALKAKKKTERETKSKSAMPAAATKGKKPASLIKPASKKK